MRDWVSQLPSFSFQTSCGHSFVEGGREDGYAAPNLTSIDQRPVDNVRQGHKRHLIMYSGSVTHALVRSGSVMAGLAQSFSSLASRYCDYELQERSTSNR